MFLFLLALPSPSSVVVAATTVTNRMAATIILRLEVQLELAHLEVSLEVVQLEVAQVTHVKVLAHPVIKLHKPLLQMLYITYNMHIASYTVVTTEYNHVAI